MPIAILRTYIQQILPHSSMTQVNTTPHSISYNSSFPSFPLLSQISLFDANDRLLNDQQPLRSLQHTINSSTHLPIRFTLFNTITSLGHCSCASPLSTQLNSSSSSSPTIIKHETINQTLSTCSLIPPTSTSSTTASSSSYSSSIYSPCLSSSPPSSNHSVTSISIVNLLTPPASSSSSSPSTTSTSHASFVVEKMVESNEQQSIIDEITSQFGEICSPLPSATAAGKKKSRHRVSKKVMSSNVPLDLSLKKRPCSFDLFSSQAKWIKT